MKKKAIKAQVQPVVIPSWQTCNICGVNGPYKDKCPCCGWSYSTTLVIAGLDQVQTLCTNVFKYSHSLFLEALEVMKKGA